MEHPTKTLPVVSVPEMSPERRLLWEAARLIEERGWCQNTSQDEKGAVCITGALKLADGLRHDALNWRNTRAERSYNIMLERLGMFPPFWNDDAGRTKEEVINALRMAALS